MTWNQEGSGRGAGEFPPFRVGSLQTTRWTMVLAAGAGPSIEASQALELLCETYWYPLYAYSRRHGYSPSDAEDQTQEFFSNVFERHFLDRATPERGRFRAYLFTAYKRFLATVRERQRTLKRGGGRRVISLNSDEGEGRLVREPTIESTPSLAFERDWAISLLNKVLGLLEEEFAKRDKVELFAKIKGVLSGSEVSDYEALSTETGLTPGALRVAVHRMRQRYGELLRQEILHTVASEEEFDEEYRSLLAALRQES